MADIIRRCKDCGKVLPEGSGNRRLYCDACRKLRKKETNHAYHQKYIIAKQLKAAGVRYCAVCGKALPEGSAANRKYCFSCAERIRLDDARERARRVREAKPKAEKPAPTPKVAPEKKLSSGGHRKVDKPCKECGTMMYGVDPGRFYCDDCKKHRYAKLFADTDPQTGIVKPKEKPKTNHDLLVDDNAAAAAKGMSYGHFKEWQRRQKELKERGEIY